MYGKTSHKNVIMFMCLVTHQTKHGAQSEPSAEWARNQSPLSSLTTTYRDWITKTFCTDKDKWVNWPLWSVFLKNCYCWWKQAQKHTNPLNCTSPEDSAETSERLSFNHPTKYSHFKVCLIRTTWLSIKMPRVEVSVVMQKHSATNTWESWSQTLTSFYTSEMRYSTSA